MSMLPPRELNTHCPQCRAEMPASERHCGNCGLDREAYLAVEAASGPAFASARRWILGLACLMSLATVVLYWQLGDLARSGVPGVESQRWLLVMPVAVVALCYFGLWLWSRKRPFEAALAALALFVTLHLYNAILDPGTLTRGIIIKVMVVMVLVGAVRAGLKAQRIRARYARETRPRLPEPIPAQPG